MFLRFMQAGLGAAALVAAVPPLAAEAGQTAPVVVTATRVAQTADQTLASVTVIDRAEIERRQATSLPELLRCGAASALFRVDTARTECPSVGSLLAALGELEELPLENSLLASLPR